MAANWKQPAEEIAIVLEKELKFPVKVAPHIKSKWVEKTCDTASDRTELAFQTQKYSNPSLNTTVKAQLTLEIANDDGINIKAFLHSK